MFSLSLSLSLYSSLSLQLRHTVNSERRVRIFTETWVWKDSSKAHTYSLPFLVQTNDASIENNLYDCTHFFSSTLMGNYLFSRINELFCSTRPTTRSWRRTQIYLTAIRGVIRAVGRQCCCRWRTCKHSLLLADNSSWIKREHRGCPPDITEVFCDTNDMPITQMGSWEIY